MSAKVSLLYDGQCGLCLRSERTIEFLNWLGLIEPVNFRNEAERQRVAPDIAFEDLDKSMHIRLSDGRTYEGFYAFRKISWYLPLTWLIAPFLYVPGVPLVGTHVYAHIAKKRHRCTSEYCTI